MTDRGSGRAARLAERLGVQHVADNAELVRRADVVLIAVKPIDVERVLREASELIDAGTAVVSVAAGVATTTLENVLEQGVPLFRCMPNVGVKVGAGTLCFASGPFTGSDAEARVLGWLGRSARSSRSRSGCSTPPRRWRAPGPAFLGLVIEAFEDAGITSGLSAATARALILSTMVGTANVLEETGVSCSDLRRMVTSPGGTAAAGLAQMERASVRGGIIDGVLAALARAGQLG